MTGRARRHARRVVVTGLGAVTPIGDDLPSTLDGLRGSASGLSTTTALDGRERVAGSILGFDPQPHFVRPKALKVSDRKTQLAVAAGSMALRSAEFPSDAASRDTLAVVLGCALGDLEADRLGLAVAPDPEARSAEDAAYFGERVMRGLTPLWLLVNLPSMLAAQVAIQLDAAGPNHTVISERIAGLQAIVEGWDLVRTGAAAAALVGGAESPLTPFCFAALRQGGGAGDGAPLGEGAAALLLESEEQARLREARPLAEIAGAAVRTVRCAAGARSAGASAAAWTAAIISAMEGALACSRATSRAGWENVGVVTADSPVQVAAEAEDAALARLGLEREATCGAELRQRCGDTLGAAGALAAVLAIASSSGGRRAPGMLLCNALGHTGLAASVAVGLLHSEAT